MTASGLMLIGPQQRDWLKHLLIDGKQAILVVLLSVTLDLANGTKNYHKSCRFD